MTSTITFDEEKRIWKSVEPLDWDFIGQTLGTAFLNSMRSIEPGRELELYFDTGLKRTAGEIYRDAVTVASNLRRLGVAKGDVVVLYTLNNPVVSALAFGCYMLGAVVTYFETMLPPEHIDETLRLIEPAAILFEENYRKDLHDSLARLQLTTQPLVLSVDGKDEPSVSSELLRPIAAADVDHFRAADLGDPQRAVASYVLTSGSTGRPKVVQLNHAVMLHGLITWWSDARRTERVTAASVLFSFSPLRWISQVQIMCQALILGATRVCATRLPEAHYGCEIMRRTRISHFFTTPDVFHEMLNSVPDSDTRTFASLRAVMLGGEPPAQSVVDLARRRAADCKVYRGYGMTEVAGLIGISETINGGPPASNLEVKVIDESGQPLGYGRSGQLCLRTQLPFGGYLKLDRSRYMLAYGFFVTGDYGFMDGDGNLHVQARYADLVRSGDVTLVPHAVEVVVNGVFGVGVCRLAGFRAAPADRDDIGALFVVLHGGAAGASLDYLRGEIRKALSAKLGREAAGAICRIHFVRQLPLTTCGKIDRAALRQLAREMHSPSIES